LSANRQQVEDLIERTGEPDRHLRLLSSSGRRIQSLWDRISGGGKMKHRFSIQCSGLIERYSIERIESVDVVRWGIDFRLSGHLNLHHEGRDFWEGSWCEGVCSNR
jgi:hypothetical protein